MLKENYYNKIRVETPEEYLEAVRNGYDSIAFKGDKKKVFELLEKHKDEDDDILYSYAEYLEYLGAPEVKSNVAEAKRIYTELADRNNPRGALRLGIIALENENYTKAKKYLKIAADQGEREALCNLGFIYEMDGNESKAIDCYQKSANLGSLSGLFNMGSKYEYGDIGGEPNYETAFEYYMKAAEGGAEMAETKVGIFYFNGWHVDKDMDKAIEWISKAANKNNPSAQYSLGLMYLMEGNVDKEKSLYWMKRAAQNGDKDAIDFLNGK